MVIIPEFFPKCLIEKIIVSDIPLTATCAELEQLFSKIASVQEVYIPPLTPTGLSRGFAIVKIVADDVTAKKCIRAFNGCHWKGARLRVESAKMHYQDKLNQEKIENDYLPYDKGDHSAIKPANTADMVLRLRNRKNSHVFVSTAPTRNKSILSGSRPCKFNESGDLVIPHATVINEMNIRRVESKCATDYLEEDSDSNSSQSDSSNSSDSESDGKNESSNPNSGHQHTAVVNAAPASGRRVGFGSIASLPPREIAPARASATGTSSQASCVTCVEDIDTNRSLNLKPPSKRNVGANKEDEDRIITEGGCYDELSDDGDDERWNAPGELDEEALEAERKRQKQILMALLMAPSSIEGESVVDSQSVAPVTNDVTPVPQRTSRPGDIRSTSASAWGAPRFDPFAAVTAAGTDMESLKLSREEIAHRRAQEKEAMRLEKATRTGTAMIGVGQVLENEDEGDRARFADLDRLKGIFHREGGVNFGENGFLSEVVAREGEGSSLIRDRLYMEAEKLAIDVRDDGKGKDGKEVAQMKFGFFDNLDTYTTAVVGPVTESTNVSRTGGTESRDGDSMDEQTFDEDDEVSIHERFAMPSLLSVVANAFCFQRDTTEEKIVESWKTTKEKLVIDYKRKSKEARKKVASTKRTSTSGSLDAKLASSSSLQADSNKSNRFDNKKKLHGGGGRGGSGKRRRTNSST